MLTLLFTITGCVNNTVPEVKYENEKFIQSATLDDSRVIHFTFDVPNIKGDSVMNELVNGRLNINDFFGDLKLVDGLNDGGSKIYKYNAKDKLYGDESFYVIECNSFDGIKDIYVARSEEILHDKCSLKIDDLDDVSMVIKEGSLTRAGATIIIIDNSDRENIYGDAYSIEKKVNEQWQELDTIIDNYAFNAIGYMVDDNNKLELVIDWKWLYGELEDGEYRIVKDTSEAGEGIRHYITVTFVIDKNIHTK